MADTTVSKFRKINQALIDADRAIDGKPVHAELVAAMLVNNQGKAVKDTDTDVSASIITGSETTSATTLLMQSGSYCIVIPVTAVSGTSPTLDIVVQESDDGGLNWFDVYHFERISATGVYRSSLMPYRGNAIRYVQTVGGTTPSFTRSILRNNKAIIVPEYRRIFNRSLDVTIQNASTPFVNIEGCDSVDVFAKLSAYASTGPTLRLLFSDEAISTSNYVPGTNLALSATTLTRFSPILAGAGYRPKFMRINVSTAGGAGNVLEYLSIKAWKA